MAYATLAQFREYKIQPNGSASAPVPTTDDALITRLLGVAQAEIERICRRTFEAVAQTRTYGDTNARIVDQRLYLDRELLTVTSITNGSGQVVPAGGYWLEPRNEPPYSMIFLKTSYVWLINVDTEIEVTGTWGASATPPADIEQATLELTAYLYDLRKQQNYDVTAVPELGQMIIPGGFPKHVENVLKSHKRRW